MLLSSQASTSTSSSSQGGTSFSSDEFDESLNNLTTYLHQRSGCSESEVNIVVKEHSYSKPWNWRPENAYIKPIKKLFFSELCSPMNNLNEDDEIDIENDIDEPPKFPIDLTRARYQMEELQRLANFAKPENDDDWDEKLDKILWSTVQNRIFSKVVRILTSELLTRQAKAHSEIEPVFRRISTDTSAKRFREVMTSISWDIKITQWLHSLFLENLPQDYLAIYFDILQSLRTKIPHFIDKMIAIQTNVKSPLSWETLVSGIKRTWDPISGSLNMSRIKKLPGNPILIVVPSGSGFTTSTRQHKWISQLGAFGMVVTVHTHLGLSANRMSMIVCVDQLIQATRAKIQDVRTDYPGRPILLVGLNSGAVLAVQVSQMEHVSAIICLGFPFYTADGKRGTMDDGLLELKCPIMFVIGQNAALVRPADLENLREKMLVVTSLVVVGSADDHLRISTFKKLSEGITQSMVDRCILEEVGDFISSILLQPHPVLSKTSSTANYENKCKKEPRKRRNSASNSIENEVNPPVMKISRPSTPVSSTSITASNITSKMLNTQQTLMSVSGQNINNVPVKRKSRAMNNQKSHFVEQLITTRLPTQQTIVPGSGGITLNIGSLASLAPIGPIRLSPAMEQIVTSATKSHSSNKTTSVSSKVSTKVISSNSSTQHNSKSKNVMSTNKYFSKVIPSNYRQVNISEKNGDTKLVNVLTPSGNQLRINTPTTAINKNIGPATSSNLTTNLLQSGRTSVVFSNSPSTMRTSSGSSILLTSNDTTTNTTSTSSTTKVTVDMESTKNTNRAILGSAQTLDLTKISTIPFQNISDNTDNFDTSCGNIVLLADRPLNTRTTCPPTILSGNNHNAGTILSISNKPRMSHKPLTAMPKITVNTNNLQKNQRPKFQVMPKKNLTSDIEEDIGNILDIPIIFAKDDDNIIEKTSLLSSVTNTANTSQKVASKLNATKVVLLSNKTEKLQQQPKITNPSMQTIICSNNTPTQNINHVILQTRSQGSTVVPKSRFPVQTIARTSNPTIKYTKIILTKRTSLHSNQQIEKIEPVLLTKPNEKVTTSTIVSIEKNEHRYAQMQPHILTKFQNNFINDSTNTVNIEETTDIVPEIDLTSPRKLD